MNVRRREHDARMQITDDHLHHARLIGIIRRAHAHDDAIAARVLATCPFTLILIQSGGVVEESKNLGSTYPPPPCPSDAVPFVAPGVQPKRNTINSRWPAPAEIVIQQARHRERPVGRNAHQGVRRHRYD